MAEYEFFTQMPKSSNANMEFIFLSLYPLKQFVVRIIFTCKIILSGNYIESVGVINTYFTMRIKVLC
jgi:hypothetical protein